MNDCMCQRCCADRQRLQSLQAQAQYAWVQDMCRLQAEEERTRPPVNAREFHLCEHCLNKPFLLVSSDKCGLCSPSPKHKASERLRALSQAACGTGRPAISSPDLRVHVSWEQLELVATELEKMGL